MVEHVCTAFPYQISGKTLDISGLFAIYSKLYAVKAISANRTSIVCGFIVETPPPPLLFEKYCHRRGHRVFKIIWNIPNRQSVLKSTSEIYNIVRVCVCDGIE